MKIPLIKEKRPYLFRPGPDCWSDSEPFVANSQGPLIHRPKTITNHVSLGKRHIAINYYCGGSSNGLKKFTFLSKLNDRHIVCKRCELAAVECGLQSSEEINGGHAHLGGVKAVAFCCNVESHIV